MKNFETSVAPAEFKYVCNYLQRKIKAKKMRPYFKTMEMHRNRKTKHDTDNNKTKRIKVKRLQIESKTAVFIKPHPK